MKTAMKTVAIGISGGVDSAVAAALLKQQGFEVLGVFLWCYQTRDFPCTTDQDRAMAVKVAHHLNIPIKILDLRKEYKKAVIDYFFSEYKDGRTPNPDVVCNKEIKFGLFYKKAIEEWKMDYVATGHYAKIVQSAKCKVQSLAMAKDKNKDQSYFLYTLNDFQLEHILFPIGDYSKEEVRKMAKQFGLPNWDRPDSQGICFVGEVDIKKFLSTKPVPSDVEGFKIQKGAVVNTKGEIIGEQDGVWFYTIGQRHGFQITDNRKQITERKPLYVLGKNSERNELVVGEKEECFRKEFEIEKMHWVSPAVIPAPFGLELMAERQAGIHTNYIDSRLHGNDKKGLTVRIRHLGEMYPCKIEPVFSSVIPTEGRLTSRVKESCSTEAVEEDPSTRPPLAASLGMTYKIVLSRPAFAVAPGQSAVLYLDDIVLGGGIIT